MSAPNRNQKIACKYDILAIQSEKVTGIQKNINHVYAQLNAELFAAHRICHHRSSPAALCIQPLTLGCHCFFITDFGNRNPTVNQR
jgi:hypothetical protein